MSSQGKPPPPFAGELGRRLRAVRTTQGMSLRQVEDASGGLHKAVLVAAWERGDRRISVVQLVELLRFYGVPVTGLLTAGGLLPDGMPDAGRRLGLDAAEAVL